MTELVSVGTLTKEGIAKIRLERLRLYNYLVHKAVYPSSYGGGVRAETTMAGQAHYQRVEERTQALTKRILGRLTGVCDTAVTWAPKQHDTYVVAEIVKGGAAAVPESMSVPLSVSTWKPLPVRTDCEGGQGWIYCPKDLAEQVAMRIMVLDGGSRPSPDIYNYAAVHGAPLPPAGLNVRMGHELARLAEKGKYKAPVIKVPQEAVPARRISDEDALDQIAKLVLDVSYDMAGMCHRLEEIILLTGRTS